MRAPLRAELRRATGFTYTRLDVGLHPRTFVGGNRHAVPASGSYGTSGAAQHPGGVYLATTVGLTEALARPHQGSRRPHKGPCGTQRYHCVGSTVATTAPVGKVARSPQDGLDLSPPSTGTTPATALVHNTLHTARVQTHSPPGLHSPYARPSRPLPFAKSALGTPHHATPLGRCCSADACARSHRVCWGHCTVCAALHHQSGPDCTTTH